MEALDTQWLDEVNAMEHSMDIFYPQRVQQITLTFFYIQRGNIIHTRRTKVNLQEACFNTQDLSKYIRNNRYLDTEFYQVSQVIKYNYTITPQELLGSEPYEAKLEVIPSLHDITFQDTIPCFNSLNELMFIMVLKKHKEPSTKKVRIHKCLHATRKHSPKFP
jgi:hypothetical protein